GRLRFEDPEGLGLELMVDDSGDEPLRARHPEIPEEHALMGFAGARAFTSDVSASKELFENTLGFEPDAQTAWTIRGEHRGSFFIYDDAPGPGVEGAGTVHHIAWATPMDEHEAWQKRVAAAGMNVTPVIDRFYFKSIYFREPSGVLFEIATLGPGFAVDEPLETLGQDLALPPNYRHLRAELEKQLTPLPDPRAEDLTRP
ncbi:MAG: glyoxalase family protein, partial [Actinomycetota bacterium]|nr:glyoxalase family protein [Actinomycetota bacterium]